MDDIKAILFDKDGTLFDFAKTWGPYTGNLLREVGAPFDRVEALAHSVRFDLENDRHFPDSPFIAGTVKDWIGSILSVVPEIDAGKLEAHILKGTATVTQVPAAPLVPLLDGLRQRGLALGVATNDSEMPARTHLSRNKILDHFDFVAGFDSGHGAKPEPGMILAFARSCDLPPEHILMVGDSLHDLHAGKAAGTKTLGVLTGYASRSDLAPHADSVLDSIADLPGWLDARKATGRMSQTT